MTTHQIDSSQVAPGTIIASKRMGMLWVSEVTTLDNGYIKVIVTTEDPFELTMHIAPRTLVNVAK